MRGTFIILLIFALLVTIFTVQNATVITVKFFMWEVNVSLALIILICLMIGAIVTIFLGIKKEIKLKKENKKLLIEISRLKENSKEKLSFKEAALDKEKYDNISKNKNSQ